MFKQFFCSILIAIFWSSSLANAAPTNFTSAKIESRKYVYFDRTEEGTFYCGCKWEWVGKSGGRTDLASCGYKIRAQETRANRIEWEHISPAENLGRNLACWKRGGREECKKSDPLFNVMESNMFNITVSVGEANVDRLNYNFGMLPSTPLQHGACPIKIDFKQRTVEPRDAIKGMIARTYFYMFDRYDLRMSDKQQQLFMAWNKMYPVSEWELERNRRIASRMGHNNEFVTGERAWTLNRKNSGDGLKDGAQKITPPKSYSTPALSSVTATTEKSTGGDIRGNKNSKIYHLPQGCPSYNAMSKSNIIEFKRESDAVSAGYRKAKNCK